MARLKVAQCPSCGAEVKLDPESDQARCAYCGTSSFVQRTTQAPPAGVPVIVVRPHASVWLALGLGLAAVLVAGLAVSAVSSRSEPVPAPPPVVSVQPALPAPVTSIPPKIEEPAPSAPTLRIEPHFVARLADVDGDRRVDVVAAIALEGANRTLHYARFDAQDGTLKAQTPALEDGVQELSAVTGSVLVEASRTGQLSGYDLVSGHQAWSTALGERAIALCELDDPDSLGVETDGARHLVIDVKSGRQTEARERCQSPLARTMAFDAPRDRRDHAAPRGLEAWRCGGVTVMGDENYRVPDACLSRAHIDTDRLPGLVGHRLWRLEKDWLVLGVRVPGAYVPMVGRISHGKLRWKSEVPAENPLEAEEGGPRFATIAGDALALAYTTSKERIVRVTALALEDATRRYTVTIPRARGDLTALSASNDTLLVQTVDELHLLNAADGSTRAVIGAQK